LKWPPVFPDLYTVTPGIREHRIAFNKEISKFSHCVEADDTALLVTRILWRFGDACKEPEVQYL
jgi:hypothetical protein